MCGPLLRPIFYFINAIFFLAGASGICFAFVHQNSHSLYQRCPQCHHLQIIIASVSGFFVLLGLVGGLAVYQRSRIIFIIYKLLLFVLFLIAVAYITVVALLHGGKFDSFLLDGWNEAVDESSGTVCEFEEMFRCSGWGVLCDNSSASHAARGFSKCPDCDPHTYGNITKYTETCESLLQGSIDTDFKWMMIGGAIAVGLIVFLNLIGFCIKQDFTFFDTLEKRGVDLDDEESMYAAGYRRVNR